MASQKRIKDKPICCVSSNLWFVRNRILSYLPRLKNIAENDKDVEANDRQIVARNELYRRDIDSILLKRRKIRIIKDTCEADKWDKIQVQGTIFNSYFKLSKARLSLLIMITAVGGFIMSPVPTISASSLMSCALGTFLLSASANACNQFLEAPYDAQMKRTQSRLLVLHRFTSLHTAGFCSIASILGACILFSQCSALTASLGLFNVLLYTGVYTPMKRHHSACTWVGAIVGAVPPLMGYAAATGEISMASLVLAAIIYSWQFPHFNALSWNLRSDYSRAGYRVMCVTNEKLCRETTLRHSLALLGLCSVAAPLSGFTSLSFALDSIPLNAYIIYLSYKFYLKPDAKSSRLLFKFTLLYLPLIMLLMIMSNYGSSRLQQNEHLNVNS